MDVIQTNKKLKIAVFHNLSPGGAMNILQNHVAFLIENGHHVDLVVLDTVATESSLLKSIVNNYYEFPVKRSVFQSLVKNIINLLPINIKLDDNSRFSISFNQIKKAQKKIAEFINNDEYDIFLSEQDGFFSFSPVLLKYIKKPTIYYCQQPMTNEKIINDLIIDLNFSRNPFFNKILEKLYPHMKNKWARLDVEYAQYANNILANSFYAHEKILSVYGKNSQVSYLGIDDNIFFPRNFEREDYILSAGAITPEKGYDFLIKSIGFINHKIRPKIYIVGYSASKEWLNYLKLLAEEYDVNLKIFEGISNDKLAEMYNKAKIFCFTNFLSTFGLVSLEAMACGTPVVAVKEGGIREVINHGEDGFLVPRDEEEFAKAITNLLKNQELWNYISNNSKKSIQKYWTKKHASQRLLNHMYKVLEKNK
jgi:glycosyltransferase involved in cell wall biosynthesis